MSSPLTAAEVLDREFLALRARILDLAAAFDRLERASGSAHADQRLHLLREALDVVRGAGPERAERVQLVFSRPYDADWRAQFGPPL